MLAIGVSAFLFPPLFDIKICCYPLTDSTFLFTLVGVFFYSTRRTVRSLLLPFDLVFVTKVWFGSVIDRPEQFKKLVTDFVQ
jgi:hypothetical protein